MGTVMQVAGVWKRRRWQYGVSLPKFFAPPRLIGPRRRPRQVEPIVQQYFAERPAEDLNFPRPHWARDKPLGHFYKENPYFLKKLRDAAAAQVDVDDDEVGKVADGVEEAEVVTAAEADVEASEEAEVVTAAEADVEASEEEELEDEEEVKADGVDERRLPRIVIPEGGFLPLSNLQDNPFSRKNVKRVGRGIGSGKGKTCGRGHKGQKSRRGHKPRFGFEGGQTPLRLRLPRKYESKSPFELQFKNVGLDRIKEFILRGKIDPAKLITMKTLHDTRCSGKYIQDGVQLLGRGQKNFDIPIHIEVSRCTTSARMAIEAAGGSVRKVHYNKLGLKALIDPLWFKKKGRLLPRAARPKPKIAPLVDAIGRLPAPLSPILPEGFVLKAPVYGHPWPSGEPQAKTDEPEPPKTDA